METTLNTTEDYYSRLQEARKENEDKKQTKKRSKTKDVSFPIIDFVVGASNDLVDMMVIGAIPLIGDLFDLLTTAILFISRLILHTCKLSKQLKSITLWSLVELVIPFGDFIPSYSISVLRNWHREKNQKEDK